ncbi:MAG TPA: glycosyltransferase family 4 protein [Gemmatimonas sp.]|nr:glycosyltransferase family 4 protein [Gemmatimonas sp.]
MTGSRPRILLVSQEGLYPDFVGGMEVRGAELHEALARFADVTVLSRTRLIEGSPALTADAPFHPTLTGAPSTRSARLLQHVSWRAGVVAAQRGARRGVRRQLARVRPDLIYLNSASHLSPAVMHALLTWGAPVVAWFGDRQSRLAQLFGEEWRRGMSGELGQATRLLPDATMDAKRIPEHLQLVFNCRWLREFYVPQFPAGTPHHVVYDGVDAEHFAPLLGSRHLAPEGEAPVRFTFLGRAVPEKGLIEFAVAMVRVDARLRALGDAAPELEVEIIGDGEALAPALEILSRSGFGARVTALGVCQHSAVPVRLRRGSVMVTPSRDEALPAATMEAMACALPVIATDVGGTNEVVLHGETGLLVPVGDADALLEACMTLAQSAELRHRFGAAARARVLQQFRRHDGIEASVAAMRAAMQHPAPTERTQRAPEEAPRGAVRSS